MAPASHGTPVRGIDLAPGSVLNAGRFGRLFRNLPVYEHDETTPRVGPVSQLAAIATAMIEAADPKDTAPVPDPEPPDADENPLLPAGYTLGLWDRSR